MDDRFTATALGQVLKNREAVNRTATLLGPVEAANGSTNTDAPIKGLALIAHGFLSLNLVLSEKKRRRGLIIPSIYLLMLDLMWLSLGSKWSLAFPEVLNCICTPNGKRRTEGVKALIRRARTERLKCKSLES